MGLDTTVHVAGVAIRIAIKRRSFSSADVWRELEHDADSETVEAVLEQLAIDGWIARNESSPMTTWKADTLVRTYGNMVRYRKDFEGVIPVLPEERSDN